MLQWNKNKIKHIMQHLLITTVNWCVPSCNFLYILFRVVLSLFELFSNLNFTIIKAQLQSWQSPLGSCFPSWAYGPYWWSAGPSNVVLVSSYMTFVVTISCNMWNNNTINDVIADRKMRGRRTKRFLTFAARHRMIETCTKERLDIPNSHRGLIHHPIETYKKKE